MNRLNSLTQLIAYTIVQEKTKSKISHINAKQCMQLQQKWVVIETNLGMKKHDNNKTIST